MPQPNPFPSGSTRAAVFALEDAWMAANDRWGNPNVRAEVQDEFAMCDCDDLIGAMGRRASMVPRAYRGVPRDER